MYRNIEPFAAIEFYFISFVFDLVDFFLAYDHDTNYREKVIHIGIVRFVVDITFTFFLVTFDKLLDQQTANNFEDNDSYT